MKTIGTLLLLAGVVACASNSDFGKSHEHNLSVQAVHPEAATEGTTADGMDGIKAGIAIEQYKSADNSSDNERLVRDVADSD